MTNIDTIFIASHDLTHYALCILQLTLNNAEASSENIQTLKNSIESELPKILSSDSKNTDEKLDVSYLPHRVPQFGNIIKYFVSAVEKSNNNMSYVKVCESWCKR